MQDKTRTRRRSDAFFAGSGQTAREMLAHNAIVVLALFGAFGVFQVMAVLKAWGVW